MSQINLYNGDCLEVLSTLNTKVLDGAFVTYIGTNSNSIEQAKAGILRS